MPDGPISGRHLDGDPYVPYTADDLAAQRADAPPGPHRPMRGSDVEAWLKRRRDVYDGQAGGEETSLWMELDSLIDDYRRRADFGLTLNDHPEGVPPDA